MENRLKRVEKVAKVGGDKMAKVEYGLLLRYKDALEQGKSARTVTCENEEEEACAKQMFLLTTKPVLYVCNVDDTSAATGNAYVEQVREAIKGEDAQLIDRSPPRPRPTSPNWKPTRRSRCSSKTSA